MASYFAQPEVADTYVDVVKCSTFTLRKRWKISKPDHSSQKLVF